MAYPKKQDYRFVDGPVDHVVVFGDSLSDIGRKWSQPMGMVAGLLPECLPGESRLSPSMRMLAVSATGRFSDSKNWTDYMFEDTAGQSLISPTREATIAASGEYHRLSSRWINPAGGSRFRYANYAVGGAVGWKAVNVDKKAGLTTFSDQVKEFERDLRGISMAGGGRWLFIVMFGANDIYTDVKTTNRSKEIANGIIKQCEKVSELVGETIADFVVTGVARPQQSVFYSAQLAGKSMAVQQAEGQVKASKFLYEGRKNTGSAVRNNKQDRFQLTEAEKILQQAEKEKKEFNDLCNSLNDQAVVLNQAVFAACVGKGWHYFSMREAMLALQEAAPSLNINARLAQTPAHFGMTSHKKGNIHFSNPEDTRLDVSGVHALFTADQKHPTSRGYKALWTRMQELLEKEGLAFGILAGPQEARRDLLNADAKWQRDSEVHTCQKCDVKFGVFTRKHHCRQCGRIFCNNCTKKRAVLEFPLKEGSGVRGYSDYRGEKFRVCDECYGELQMPGLQGR